jgi:23S rRNA pseudouridine2457 synthase
MVSQFLSPDKVNLLGDLNYSFPEGTHAIGRLDNNSEGLLLLTTNKKVTRLLFNAEKSHARTYLVKVKNRLSAAALEKLRTGVRIRIRGDIQYLTPACEVELVSELREETKPAGSLREIPVSWLKIVLYEGKFHQVRKMVAAIGHPCMRLIRISIEDIHLGELKPGEVIRMEEEEFFRKLKINDWEEKK